MLVKNICKLYKSRFAEHFLYPFFVPTAARFHRLQWVSHRRVPSGHDGAAYVTLGHTGDTYAPLGHTMIISPLEFLALMSTRLNLSLSYTKKQILHIHNARKLPQKPLASKTAFAKWHFCAPEVALSCGKSGTLVARKRHFGARRMPRGGDAWGATVILLGRKCA